MTELRSDLEILHANEQMPDFGGSYYNPVCDLEEHGRKICNASLEPLGIKEEMNLEPYLDDTYFISTLLSELSKRIKENEIIFGIFENDRFRMAPFIYSPERLIDFERQVIERLLRRRGYYAINEERANRALRNEFEIK